MEENYNRQTISLFNNFENVGRISILNEPKKKNIFQNIILNGQI